MQEHEIQKKILLGLHDFFTHNKNVCLGDSQISKALDCSVEEARYHLQKLESLGYIKTKDASTLNGECLVVMNLTSTGWMAASGKIEIDMGDRIHSQSSYIGTQVNQTFHAPVGVQQTNLGDVSGDLNNTIDQLNELNSPETTELAKLLGKMKELLESESNLSSDDKVEALEQVKILAEVGQNPTDNRMQKAAKTAVRVLKGIVSELPTATKLVEGLNSLLPEVSKLLGF
jgi:DNA-binding Lrp family transcriptional regulator